MNNPNIWAIAVIFSGAGYLVTGCTTAGAVVGAMVASCFILWINKPYN